MIRERVSTQGLIRPLEPQGELDAFRLPPELIGEISELAVRRYIEGTAKFGKKFGKTTKAIEKARRKNLDRASQDTMHNLAQLHMFLDGNGERDESHSTSDKTASASSGTKSMFLSKTKAKLTIGESSSEKAITGDTPQGVKEGLAASGSWPWAWALDVDENPPPSSIVSRRDTAEARRLAKIADQSVFMDEKALSANNLWSLIVNFLTVTPERDVHKHTHKHQHGHSRQANVAGKGPQEQDTGVQTEGNGQSGPRATTDAAAPTEKRETVSKREKMRSHFAWLVTENRKSHGRSASVSSKAQADQ